MNSASTIRFVMWNTISSKTWMCVFITRGNRTSDPPSPPLPSTQKISICLWGKKICVKTMSCDETRTLVNLFNCYLLSFIRSSGRKGSRRCSRCAAIKERERERGLCLVLAVACMLRAKLGDQWQRGCYHSTWSRHSSRGEGRRWGGWWWGGPWWFILIGAQSFVLKGEGEKQAVGSKSLRIS